MKKRLLYVITGIILTLLLADTQPPISNATQSNCQLFKETGKSICGKFLDYWNRHGGLPQQGFPISDEIQEVSDTNGKIYTVQYLERAVFELHPENAGTPYEVLLTLLGSQRYLEYYGPGGAPNQRPSADNPRFFQETKRTIGGVFRRYWEQHGGLMQQGYPISDEFEERSTLDGKTYKVQYFERAAFEWHPENAGTPHEVLLTQLGRFSYRGHHGTLTIPGPVAPDLQRRNEQASDRYFMWSEVRIHDPGWPNTPIAFTTVAIRALDLTTQRVINVTEAPDLEDYTALSGSIAVGLRKSRDPKCSVCDRDVIAKDLSTGATFTLASGPGVRYSPQIAGRVAAWREQDAQTMRIVTMNIDTGVVTVPYSRPIEAKILRAFLLSEQYLVWSEGNTSGPPSFVDVQAYNLRDGSTRQVAHYIGAFYNPKLFGRYLAWTDQVLHLTDLDTAKTSAITEEDAYGVAIRGDTMLWLAQDPAIRTSISYKVVGMKRSKMQPLEFFSVGPYLPPLFIASDWLIWKESNISYRAISIAQAFRDARKPDNTSDPNSDPTLVQARLQARIVAGNNSIFWLGRGIANKVYRYDLATRSKTILYESPEQKLTLTTDGRSVIWIEFSPDARYRIRHYDLSTSQVSTVVQTESAQYDYGLNSLDQGAGSRSFIAVDAGVLYYIHNDPAHKGLWARTLASGQEQLVSPAGVGPLAADGKLLWLEDKLGYGTILHLRIAATPANDIVLANEQYHYVHGYTVGGDNVLWHGRQGNLEALNRYFIPGRVKTTERSRAPGEGLIFMRPLIRGNTAVWTEETFGHGDPTWSIWSMNLYTRAKSVVRTSEPKTSIEGWVMPDERTVAYMKRFHSIAGPRDLFLAHLP